MTAKQAAKSSERAPRCFVISPIGDPGSPNRLHADMVLHYIIRPALADYDIKRADDFGTPDMITDKVIDAIFSFELAIADLSGHNPNVFYDLGLRHMVEKPVIHIASAATKLPFDTAGVGTIFFDIANVHTHFAARDAIVKAVNQVTAKEYKVSNPVTQARASIKLAQSTDSTERLLGLMSKKVSDLEQQLSELQREKIFPLNPRSLGPSVLTGGPLLAPLFANSMDTGRPIGDLTFAPGTLGATIGPQPPFGYLPPVLNLGIKIPEDESEK